MPPNLQKDRGYYLSTFLMNVQTNQPSTLLTHTTEQSDNRIPPQFIDPECSLPWSQQFTTCLYPSSPHPTLYGKSQLALPSTPVSLQQPPYQYPVFSFCLPQVSHISLPLILITLKKYCGQYRSWSYSTCSFLQSPVTAPLEPKLHCTTQFNFFLAHGGKYLFLIERLMLNSNV
jgi:hypothetical protein